MGSLTETAFYTRKAVNWAILGVIGYILLRIFWSVFISLWLMFFPPQPPPPNHAFGKLPALVFPASASPSAELTYRLETIQGGVPQASNSAVVYFMPKNPASLTGLTKAQEFAIKLDFTNQPIQETKYVYRFEDASLPLRRLTYDIVSKNFILRYMFEKETSLFTERDVPVSDEALKDSKSFLQSYGLYKSDMAKATPKIQYLKYAGDALASTTSQSQSDAIRVDYFRSPINEIPLYTPNPLEGNITFIYSGSTNTKKRTLEVAYTYWPIDTATTGTYELKSSTVAWQELQNGGGYIAQLPKTSSTFVTVRNVTLGYYDTLDSQMYLQPIFVFEGDDGFLAYVPAIDPTWTEQ